MTIREIDSNSVKQQKSLATKYAREIGDAEVEQGGLEEGNSNAAELVLNAWQPHIGFTYRPARMVEQTFLSVFGRSPKH